MVASSGLGQIANGTAGQVAIASVVKSCFFWASINTALDWQGLSRRLTVLELLKKSDDLTQWKKTKGNRGAAEWRVVDRAHDAQFRDAPPEHRDLHDRGRRTAEEPAGGRSTRFDRKILIKILIECTGTIRPTKEASGRGEKPVQCHSSRNFPMQLAVSGFGYATAKFPSWTSRVRTPPPAPKFFNTFRYF
jgi:hypothetical protein